MIDSDEREKEWKVCGWQKVKYIHTHVEKRILEACKNYPILLSYKTNSVKKIIDPLAQK